MKNCLEEIDSIKKGQNKISKFLVHRNIKYSDKKVEEKVQIIENKEKMSRKGVKRINPDRNTINAIFFILHHPKIIIP